jgi:hypothetical protein
MELVLLLQKHVNLFASGFRKLSSFKLYGEKGRGRPSSTSGTIESSGKILLDPNSLLFSHGLLLGKVSKGL